MGPRGVTSSPKIAVAPRPRPPLRPSLHPPRSTPAFIAMPADLGKLLLIAVLAIVAVLAWRAWQIKQGSPNWPHVMGEMLEARARARNETGDQRGTPTHDWFTEVRYRYTVNGQTYTGTRLRAFGLNHMDEA